MALAFILAFAAFVYMVNFTIIHAKRTTFRSEEEMRKAMQGRYAIERYYEDIYIDGDDITLTYLAYSHYNRDFAERNGYDYNEHDSVYEDHIVEWDYKRGIIKTGWMGDIVVDKKGNIRRGDYTYDTFYKTDKPRPEPIDPSTLNSTEGDTGAEINAEAFDELEKRQDDLEATQDAAEEAADQGTGEGDVET